MALLNDYYIFVKDEDVKRGVSISTHPVESGLDLTDNVKREPKEIYIEGEIVGKDAAKTLEKIEALHQSGKYVKYIGRNILSNALITTFDTSHPNTIYGGCSFTMQIREVRIAKSPLVVKKTSTSKKTSSSTQQVKQTTTKKPETRTYTVKKGDCLWNIAKAYYGNGAQYPKIYNANKDKIKSNYIIYVGQVLVIP